jgi:alanyl-tRNA synthetase
VRKSRAESKLAGTAPHTLLEERADLPGHRLLAKATGPPRVIVAVFPDRDAVFVKLLAQKLTAAANDVIALLAAGAGQATLVFAQSPGQKHNMGQLLKKALEQLGGRGGGSADMAQGGLPAGSADLSTIEKILREMAATL